MGGCCASGAYGSYPAAGYNYGVGYGSGYYGSGYGGYGGLVDADPITPGIQSTPGIVTPVGPPTIAGVSTYAPPAISTYVPPVATYAPPVSTFATSVVAAPPILAPPILPPVTQPFVPAPVVPTFTGSVVGGPILRPTSFGGVRPGFGVDLDPITPGIQARPGVVTATGPTVGAGFGGIGGGIRPGFGGVGIGGPVGVGIGGPVGGFGGIRGGFGSGLDLDPITPGFQTRPGVVTATGPTVGTGFGGIGGGIGGIGGVRPSFVGGPIGGIGGVRGVGFGSGLDLDPITPGIQARPGVVTATGPTVGTGFGGIGAGVRPGFGGIGGIGGGLGGIGGIGGGIGGIRRPGFGVDLDPITPGIQNRPGVVTPTGPSFRV